VKGNRLIRFERMADDLAFRQREWQRKAERVRDTLWSKQEKTAAFKAFAKAFDVDWDRMSGKAQRGWIRDMNRLLLGEWKYFTLAETARALEISQSILKKELNRSYHGPNHIWRIPSREVERLLRVRASRARII
jgi:hypothetical protein